MKRPGSVTAAAVLSIVFGALGICTPLLSFQLFLSENLTKAPDPTMEAMRADPVLLNYSRGSAILGCLVSIALLWAGIRMLGMKPWTRTVAMGWAVLQLAHVPVELYMSLTHLLPALDKAMQDQNESVAGAARLIAQGTMAASTCFGLALPIVFLVVLTRPSAVAAFRGEPYPPPEALSAGVPPGSPPSDAGSGPAA